MFDAIPAQYATSDFSFVVEKVTTIVLRAPIDTPVQTSFGIMTDRPALYLLLQDTRGNTGVGEVWCNFPVCGAEHRQRLLDTTILPALIGKEFADPEQCFRSLSQQFQRLAIQSGEPGPIAQCIAGIDIGLWDLVAKRLELPMHKLFGSQNSTIGVYSSGINPGGAYETFLRGRDAGYTAFKLKIGFGNDIDYANIERICADLSPGDQLMLDANQAWTLDEAMIQRDSLSEFPVAWLEEPLMADSPAGDWVALAHHSTIPLAAGENMADVVTFSEANKSGWLSIMQPDMCKWGGFSGVLPVAQDALENGKRYCPHFLGGGVGLLASAHVLAAVGGSGLLEIDCNPNPLREALYAPVVENGQTLIADEPGLGIDLRTLATLQQDSGLSARQ